MKNLKNLILYIIFSQIIVNINCQPYIPKGRIYHTATLVGTKIFFLDGQDNNESLNYFFYLDVSKSFNKTKDSLPFVNLTFDDSVPKHHGAATTIIKREGHTATFLSDTGEIVYIGGCGDNGLLINMNILDVYNIINGSWNKWETKNPPEQRCWHTAVLTNDNRIIVFGGVNSSLTMPVENYYVVLNTKTLEWYHGNGNIIGAPYKGHTATYHDDYMFIAFG
ncbi:hypothetical protein RclHR1_00900028 [Rhizophagus clarus]|uniref:Galactose oxidase n=1 Tax=Rhizophagus clarus TaxID=94130 RepID=A0A2Z6SHH0_9GLOM|nr:hypothetical protein RclHR1_00900028 [Rhizophagus clarus]GES73266.1 hypothetical protein GLOIN_2v1632718 [Rhizophagus clarus]